MCNIIQMRPYNGYSQMLRLKRKNLLSPIPVACSLLFALRVYLLGLVIRYSTVSPGTVSWLELGLCDSSTEILMSLR